MSFMSLEPYFAGTGLGVLLILLVSCMLLEPYFAGTVTWSSLVHPLNGVLLEPHVQARQLGVLLIFPMIYAAGTVL